MDNKDNRLDTDSDFKKYYVKNIISIVEVWESIKSKYKQKFWVFFWSALAINCINILFVLFNILMSDKSFDITDVTTLLFFSVLFVLVPFYMYKKENKPSYVNKFFNFWGDIQYDDIEKNYITDSIFIPTGNSLIVSEQVNGKLSNYQFCMANVKSKVKLPKINIERITSKGIHISLVIPVKTEHLILWDKKAYKRNCNVKDLSEIKNINIPIANYFRIFSDSLSGVNNLISTSFFETLLDIKDVFSATSINVEIENEKIDMYLENARFPLFAKDNLIKPCLQENDFQKAYDVIEKLIIWNETIESLSLR